MCKNKHLKGCPAISIGHASFNIPCRLMSTTWVCFPFIRCMGNRQHEHKSLRTAAVCCLFWQYHAEQNRSKYGQSLWPLPGTAKTKERSLWCRWYEMISSWSACDMKCFQVLLHKNDVELSYFMAHKTLGTRAYEWCHSEGDYMFTMGRLLA